jgi:V8-like Glu-specific endopeptidase
MTLQPVLRRLLLPLMLLMLATPVRAIIGGDGVDPNRTDSPWAGVGSITIKGGGTYSGALISRRHVLTAAHVVQGHAASPGDITFNINYGGDLCYRFKAVAVYLFPQYKGTKRGEDGLWHDDIAVIELDRPVPVTIPVYPVYQGIPGVTESDTDITFVGYGAGKDAADGREQPPNPEVKRIGRNKIEQLVRNPDGRTGFDLFLYRFVDAGGKPVNDVKGSAGAALLTPDAIFAGGDSGSPVFIRENGTWKIMGVATFATALRNDADAALAPAIGGGTLVAPFVDWINDTTARPQPGGPTHAAEPDPRFLHSGIALAGFAVFWLIYRSFRRFFRGLPPR